MFPVFAAALNINQFILKCSAVLRSLIYRLLSFIAHQSCVLIITNPQHRDVNELFYANTLRYEELISFDDVNFFFDVLPNIT